MTNTFKHFKVALFINTMICILLSFIGFEKSIQLIIAVTTAGIFFCFTILWELWQYDESFAKQGYFKRKWLDIIGDIVAGNVGWLIPPVICYLWIW